MQHPVNLTPTLYYWPQLFRPQFFQFLGGRERFYTPSILLAQGDLCKIRLGSSWLCTSYHALASLFYRPTGCFRKSTGFYEKDLLLKRFTTVHPFTRLSTRLKVVVRLSFFRMATNYISDDQRCQFLPPTGLHNSYSPIKVTYRLRGLVGIW